MTTVHVHMPAPLRRFTRGLRTITLKAETVLDALLQLDGYDASISKRLLLDDRSQPRPYVNIYVDGRHIRHGDGLQALLRDEARLEIVTAFAGG